MRFIAEQFSIFSSLRVLSRGSTRSRLCPLLRKDEKTGERKKLVMPGWLCFVFGGVGWSKSDRAKCQGTASTISRIKRLAAQSRRCDAPAVYFVRPAVFSLSRVCLR